MPEYTVTIEGREYDVDAPDDRTAYRWGQKFHAQAKQALVKRQDAQRAADRATYDPTKDMSTTDKTLANLGAGFDNLLTGGQQLLSKVGLAKPVDDEELREKRERDQRLADSQQTGLGADWMPSTGKALQFAGEVAPTLAIPGGLMAKAGGKVLPQALTSTAARRAIVAGATGGGATGALMPVTSDESRTLNTLLGAGAGAALPATMAGYRAGRNLLTKRGARLKAGERLGIDANSPRPPDPATLASDVDVPLSTAATYGDDSLAQLELASRARGRSPDEWAAFDRGQRQKVFENVEQGTARAGTEDALRTQRSADWQSNVAEAMKGVKPKVWEREVAQLRANLDTALRSPQGQNEMRPVLNEIIRQMDELGPEFSPQHLAALRSRMAGSVRGSPADPFTSAPRADPSFISLRQEFDNILNATTGNRWQRVLEGYKRSSVPVAQAKAETQVQRHFETPEGTPRVPTAPEGTPIVTETSLRRAITQPEVKNRYGTAPTFAPESERVLKGTLEALQRQNITQRAKATATGGGGSMTAPLMHTIEQLDPTSASNFIMRGLQVAKNYANARAQRELDQALIDPKRYYQIVQETMAAGKPLTPGQEIAVQALSMSAGASLPRAVQSRREQQPRY